MRYLLDTNVFIWYLTENDKLNPNLFDIIAYKNNVFISIVSLQEIAIKSREGGLTMKIPFKKLGEIIKNDTNLKILQVEIKHLNTLYDFSPMDSHRDPFDHIIISQAISEHLILISADGKFPFYRAQGLNLIEND
jgi:tRNA(fMet)-specific endonuclease VapC